MPSANESSRLAWLAAAWSNQRQKISCLLARIGDLGAAVGMQPKIFGKFLRMLEQVAAAKERETEIISEIDAIERRHRFNRKLGYVKRVGANNDNVPAYENLAHRRKGGWLIWWLIILWYLMTRQQQPQINSRKQSLTVD